MAKEFLPQSVPLHIMIRLLGVTLLFAAAGAWSLGIPGINGAAGGIASPLCFALICCAVFVRNRYAALMIPGIVLSWYLAVGAAVWMWSGWYASRSYVVGRPTNRPGDATSTSPDAVREIR